MLSMFPSSSAPLLPFFPYEAPPHAAAPRWPSQLPPPSNPAYRSSRKRSHRQLVSQCEPYHDGSAALPQQRVDESQTERGVKRQEVQHNVAVAVPPSAAQPGECPTSDPASSPLLTRCASPAGSDASMTDAEAAALADDVAPLDPDSPTPASPLSPDDSDWPSNASSERPSDCFPLPDSLLFHPHDAIRPLIPLPSLSSSVLSLARASARSAAASSQQSADDEHDPSKQLIIYQPAASAAPVLATTLSRASRRARLQQAAHLYQWSSPTQQQEDSMQA